MINELLFTEKERTDATPMSYTEDPFLFYDRCDGPAFENVRLLLNRWHAAYPENERGELAGRFRSEFYATFYELALFSVFTALGCHLEPHPVLPHTTKRCDFRVSGAAEFFFGMYQYERPIGRRRKPAKYGTLFLRPAQPDGLPRFLSEAGGSAVQGQQLPAPDQDQGAIGDTD